MDSKDIGAFFMVFLFLAGIIGLIIFLTNVSEARTDKQCKKQFGQEWVGRYEHYGTNFCLNNKGERKYPL